MREIKFRAWDKEDCRMLDGEWRIKFADGKPVSIHEPKSNAMRVDRFELMQYTGLKDKHGVEIYEGDITTFEYSDNRAFIEWVEGGFRFIYKQNEVQMSNEGLHRVEVIGNIYENPELLK